MSKVQEIFRDLGDGIDAEVEVDNIWISDGDEIALLLKPSVIAALVKFQKDVAKSRAESDRRSV